MTKTFRPIWVLVVAFAFGLGVATTQTLAQSERGDHSRLTSALGALSSEINGLTDRLFRLETEERRLGDALRGQRERAQASFMGMQRIALSPRPGALIDPQSAINSARAHALLAAVRPEILRVDAETKEAVSRLGRVQKSRQDTFEALSRAEAQYDTLAAALLALQNKGQLAGPVIDASGAETTYLTSVDKLLEVDTTALQPIPASAALAEPSATPTAAAVAVATTTAQSPRPTDMDVFANSSTLVWPLSQRRVISGYSDAAASLQFRHGLVMKPSQSGANVLAPFDGQIIFSENLKGYGHTVIIRHAPNTVSILVGPLSSKLGVGAWIRKGDAVATLNDDSQSTLFWQFRRNQRLVDPIRWIN